MASANSVTIYHNPRCSKSREALALLESKGIVANVILYLDNPPTVATLQELLKQLGFDSARQLMRSKEELYTTLNLANENLTETELLQSMVAQPKLIERPIVVANGQARLGRPVDNILAIL